MGRGVAQRRQPNRRSVRAGVTPQGTGNRSAARPVGRSSGAAANNKSAVKNSKNSKKFKLIDYPRTGKRGIRRWLPSWRQILGLFLAAAALGIGVIFAARSEERRGGRERGLGCGQERAQRR